MSKLPWRPVPGEPSRSPPRLIILGVDPQSEAAAKLAKAFAPVIKSFYLGAAQNHELADRPQSRSQRQFGDDLKLTYTNQFGQETVRVEVGTEAFKKVTGHAAKPWDWALLDYDISLTGSALHANLWAKRMVPLNPPHNRPPNGEVFDAGSDGTNTDGLEPPVLRYPAPENPLYSITGPDGKQVSSLAIDLRRWGGAPVEINIYGTLTVDTQGVPYRYSAPQEHISAITSNVLTFLGYCDYDGGWIGDSPYDLWPYNGTAMQPVGVPSINNHISGAVTVLAADAPLARPMEPTPLTTFLGATGQATHWVEDVIDPASGIVTTYTVHSLTEVLLGNPGPGNPSRYAVYTRAITYEREIITEYAPEPVPATCLGDMRLVGGFGAPPWIEAEITAAPEDNVFLRLGLDDGGAPRFLQTGMLEPDVPIHGGDDDETNDYLGRLTIFPWQYGGAFERA